ncbi:MAG TPA: ABC transporter permease, partial [Tepiditoga sp.]|nr:ABC transporter permease [Tepiditoga sp.]
MKKINFFRAPEFGVSVALIGLFILMSFLSPLFLSGYNLINILLQSSTYMILSIGMTFVIVTGGIDLSVGSIAVVSGILMASLMKNGVNVYLAIIAGLIISIFCGFINGFLVSKISLPSFIVTLATMSIFQGAALIFSGGLPIYGFPKSFSFLGIGSVLSVPVPVIIALICIIISVFVFKKTKIGHYALAIGDNRQAVKMCGINIFKYEMLVYMINGFTTGIAAIITTARLNSAEPLGSMSMGLDAVAAVVMSGTSLSGGTGS